MIDSEARSQPGLGTVSQGLEPPRVPRPCRRFRSRRRSDTGTARQHGRRRGRGLVPARFGRAFRHG